MESFDEISDPQQRDIDSSSNLIGITWYSAMDESARKLILARLVSFERIVESLEAAVEACGPPLAKSHQHFDL